ncbi:MAG: hypothetical protein AAFW97_17045 [Pseudomonadota bacterium]
MNPQDYSGYADILNKMMSDNSCASCGPANGHANSGTQVRISSRIQGSVENAFQGSVGRDWVFDLASVNVDESLLDRAMIDFSGVQEILSKHRDEAIELLKHIQAGNVDRAVAIAHSIGLTEDELVSRGGGLGPFALLAVAVVLVLVTPSPISSESESPRPHPQPIADDIETMSDEEEGDMDGYFEAGD